MAKKKTGKRTKAVKRRSSRTRPSRRSARRPAPVGLAATSTRVPPPQAGVPRSNVGTTVQRFIDWDGVKDLTVEEESSGDTFTVTPTA